MNKVNTVPQTLQVQNKIDPLSNSYIKTVETAFKRVSKNNNLKLTLLFEQAGYIRKSFDDKTKTPYIVLVDNKNNKLFGLGANTENIFFKWVDGKKIPISIDQLKTGDRISYTELFNVYNSSTSAQIEVYEK